MSSSRRASLFLASVILWMCWVDVWAKTPWAQTPATPAVTVIRAGRLFDPDAGRMLTNQVIVVEGTRIREVGAAAQIPAGAQVIDLSNMTVMGGLVEAHNISP